MRDPEPYRINTLKILNNKQVAVYFSLFINSADGYNASSRFRFAVIGKNL